jgi:hypothetical protein
MIKTNEELANGQEDRESKGDILTIRSPAEGRRTKEIPEVRGEGTIAGSSINNIMEGRMNDKQGGAGRKRANLAEAANALCLQPLMGGGEGVVAKTPAKRPSRCRGGDLQERGRRMANCLCFCLLAGCLTWPYNYWAPHGQRHV